MRIRTCHVALMPREFKSGCYVMASQRLKKVVKISTEFHLLKTF